MTKNSIAIKWWGVEGNSKSVDVILTRLKKNEDVENDLSPYVVKEEHVLSKDNEPSEVVFTGLDPNTLYGIRMRGVGKGGVGNEYVYTQATRPTTPPILPEQTEDTLLENIPTAIETKEEVEKDVSEKQEEHDKDLQNKTNTENKTSESTGNVVVDIPAIIVEAPPKDEGSLETTKETSLDAFADERVKAEETERRKDESQVHEPQPEEPKPPTPPAEVETVASEKLERISTPSPPLESTEASSPEKETSPVPEPNSVPNDERAASTNQEIPQEKNDFDQAQADMGCNVEKPEENFAHESASIKQDSSSSNLIVDYAQNEEEKDDATSNEPEQVNVVSGKISSSPETDDSKNEIQTVEENPTTKDQDNAEKEETSPTTTNDEDENPQVPIANQDDSIEFSTTLNQSIKPVLVIPTKNEDNTSNGQVSGPLGSPKPQKNYVAAKLKEEPSSNTSTPLLEKKVASDLSFLAAITSSD